MVDGEAKDTYLKLDQWTKVVYRKNFKTFNRKSCALSTSYIRGLFEKTLGEITPNYLFS